MIAHHGIGCQADGKDLCQFQESVLKPDFAVLEGLAGIAIIATEEGAPHAPGCAVVVGRVIETDLEAARECHEFISERYVPTFQH